MVEPASATAETLPAAALEAVQCWAEFTKAFSIYPAANRRVQEALTRFREALPDAADTRGQVRIVFGAKALAVGEDMVEFRADGLQAWLAQRIERATLSGVVLDQDTPIDSLIAFTTHLLEHFTRRDLDRAFEDLWPTAYPGIELIDRRFDGYFDDARASESGTPEPELVKREGSGGPSTTSAAVSHVAADKELREGMEHLQDLLHERFADGEAKRTLDLVSHVVQLLPHDTARDQEAAIQVTRQVVASITEAIRSGEDEQGLARAFTDERVLNQLVLAASRTLLGSRAPTQKELDAPPPSVPLARGRKGDAAVEEDAADLCAEMESLPPPHEGRLHADTARRDEETLGVYLHYAMKGELQSFGRFARQDLVRLLGDAGPTSAPMLGEALAHADGLGRAELVDFLREERLVRLLRTSGVLTPVQVVEEFPKGFGLYLGALSPDESEDLEELDEVVSAVGSAALQRHADKLLNDEKIGRIHTVEVLLARPSEALRGMIRLLIERGDVPVRERAVAALRKLCGQEEEACLLYLWDQPASLPLDYLVRVADPHMSASDRKVLAPRISTELVRFLESPDAIVAGEARRIQAIHLLGRFYGPAAQTLLKSLVGGRRFGVLPRETRRIRAAAKQALARARAGWEQSRHV